MLTDKKNWNSGQTEHIRSPICSSNEYFFANNNICKLAARPYNQYNIYQFSSLF